MCRPSSALAAEWHEVVQQKGGGQLMGTHTKRTRVSQQVACTAR